MVHSFSVTNAKLFAALDSGGHLYVVQVESRWREEQAVHGMIGFDL